MVCTGENTIMINKWSVMVPHVKVRRHICMQWEVGEVQRAGLPLPTFFRKKGGVLIWGLCAKLEE